MLPRYRSYLLRIWQVNPAESPIWRASLEDPHTHQLTGFESMEALFNYLKKIESPDNPPDTHAVSDKEYDLSK